MGPFLNPAAILINPSVMFLYFFFLHTYFGYLAPITMTFSKARGHSVPCDKRNDTGVKSACVVVEITGRFASQTIMQAAGS